MLSRNARYVISYNGEFYNYRGMRDTLQKEYPVQWNGSSDTEVILELLVRYGVEGALERLTGMFALAIWDREEQALYLARDRFGEKPLSYSCHGGGFAFASEVAALEALPDLPKSIDSNSVAAFLNKGNLGSSSTIYKNVHKLKPGHWAKFKTGEQLVVKPYWSFKENALKWRQKPIVDPEELVAQLEIALTESCRNMMVADVPLGAFLSGGVDSSTVVALMQKCSALPIKTFTIGFENKKFNEAHHAKDVAKHIGTDHTELILTAQELPRYCTQDSQPLR